MIKSARELFKANAEPFMLQQRDTVVIEMEGLQQVLEPIKDILNAQSMSWRNENAENAQRNELYEQVQELRQMCLEVQAMQTISDREHRQERSALLNALQGVLESIEDASDDLVIIEAEDLDALSETTDIIRENALTYKEFVHKPNIAAALEKVSDNIDTAQSQEWAFDYTATSIHQAFEGSAYE